jgi:hypothetical protein
LIPAGRYQAVGVEAATFPAFRGWKVRVAWEVLLPDEHADYGHRRVRLHRYYNVRRKGTRVIPAEYGHYLREWMLVAGRRPTRGDRVAPRAFIGVLCLVEVRVVVGDAEQRALPDCARYSIVARLLERLAGGANL